MPDFYALLVAIDTYPEGIRSLAGCVNDLNAIEELLTKRFGGDTLHLLKLTNAEATRDRVIQSFRKHLGQAKKKDVALFFYAGHGSQVPTGGLFPAIEPDRLNESIVCHDSRLPGGLDLVDKDIATLIREVTAKGVHLTTIFDSCHSGSVTRGDKDDAKGADGLPTMMERRLAKRPDAQLADAYLSDPAELDAAFHASSRSVASAAPGAATLTLTTAIGYVPDETGTHVLLAACEDNQSAKEYFAGGARHGAFTYFLTQTLQTAAEPLGYRELMQLVRERMWGRVAEQTPKLESSGGDRILDNVFLGLRPAPLADYSMVRQSDEGVWTITSGSLLGIAEGDRFALYPDSANDSDLGDPGKAVASALAVGVRPNETAIEIGDGKELSNGVKYKAVLRQRSNAVSVAFDGGEAGLKLLRSATASARTILESNDPRFVVHAKDLRFTVTFGGQNRVLYGPVEQSEEGAKKVVAALEHMSRWTMHLSLHNPSSKIPADAVQFTIIANDAEQSSPPLARVELAYTKDKFGQVYKPFYKARIGSSFTKDLYIALLVFSADWSISARLLEAGTQRLATPVGCDPVNLPLPVYASAGKEIHCSIPGQASETTDDLLLVVSTDWFDAHSFELPPLADATVKLRAMEVDEPAPLHDFFTRRVTFHTTRSF
jgi:uncharacterized caspase-like protein